MSDVKPLTFRLRYRAAAYDVIDKGGTNHLARFELERDEAYDKYIPPTPEGFRDFHGTLEQVALRADVLNFAQYGKGRMLYFYFPDPAGATDTWRSDHCDICQRNAAQREQDLG